MFSLDSKTDQRIVKTHRLLAQSLLDLLERAPFGRIMVSGLCQTAQVSRATFYAHFDDKYDLLRYTVCSFCPPLTGPEAGDGADALGAFLVEHRAALRHLLLGADEETLGILCGLIPGLAGVDDADAVRDGLRHAVFCQLFSGGILRYLTWMVQSPVSELRGMNDAFFELMHLFCEVYLPSRTRDEGRKEEDS